MNEIDTWQQGHFIHSPQSRHWTREAIVNAERREQLNVRPSPKGNAICQCVTPEDAKWIAERLNLAARLERIKRNDWDA